MQLTEFLEQIQVYDFTNLGKSIKFEYYLEPKEVYLDENKEETIEHSSIYRTSSVIINKNPWAEVEVYFNRNDKKYSFMILHNLEKELYKFYLSKIVYEEFLGIKNTEMYCNTPFYLEIEIIRNYKGELIIETIFVLEEISSFVITEIKTFDYVFELLDYINNKIQKYLED